MKREVFIGKLQLCYFGDRAEEEYIVLATELYGRTITYDKPKVKKRGVR